MNNAKLRNFMTIEGSELSIKQDQSRSAPSCLNKGAGCQIIQSDLKNLSEVNYSTPVSNITSSSQVAKVIPEERSFRQMDDIFIKLGCKMKTQNSEAFSNEKLKFSRAINFIFKNNLTKEIQLKEIKIKRDYSYTKNINAEKKKMIFKNLNMSNNDNNKQAFKFFQTTNQANIIPNCSILENTKLNSNNYHGKVKTFNVSDCVLQSQDKLLIGKKRLNNVSEITEMPKIPNFGSLNQGAIEISKKVLEKSKMKTEQKSSIPINIPCYPSPISINAQNPKNFHVNMNITNINIDKSHSLIKSLPTSMTHERDLKLINELKETLKNSNVKYIEEHSARNYVLVFKISSENFIKKYQITIDQQTKKIINYEKFRGDEKTIVINNIEDSDANLIFSDLFSLLKELDSNLELST